MRPCTELNPCDPLTKYAVVFEEQPMPDSLTSCSGRISSPQQASMIAAVTESCPHPAQSVDMLPSYWRRVRPSLLVGEPGCETLGLVMNDMACSRSGCSVRGFGAHGRDSRRLGEHGTDAIDDRSRANR